MSLPLFLLLVLTAVFGGSKVYLTAFKLFLTGVAVALPLLLIDILFMGRQPANYNFSRLYVFYLFTGQGYYFIFGAAIYTFFRLIKLSLFSGSGEAGVFAFFTGLYTVITIADMVMSAGRYNYYLLFLVPLLRVSLSLLGAYCLSEILEESGLRRLIFCLLLPAIPVIGSLVPAFYAFHVRSLTFLITALYAGAALFLIWKISLTAGSPAVKHPLGRALRK